MKTRCPPLLDNYQAFFPESWKFFSAILEIYSFNLTVNSFSLSKGGWVGSLFSQGAAPSRTLTCQAKSQHELLQLCDQLEPLHN
jgi:hypothetical protein